MRNVLLATFTAALTLAAADAPYAGKWKMNPSKSDFRETTVTIAAGASGEMQFTVDGQSYTFKVDGKDYPGLFGQTAAWTQIDATTWETIDKLNGKVLSTEKTTLSADGKTITVNSKGSKPDGGVMDDTAVYQRVSGGPGLAGKWKTRKFNSSAPSVLELAPSGADGVKFSIVDFKLVCDAKLDGKDYPCTGPTLAPGWTMSVKPSGPRGLEMTDKENGKPLYQMTMTVSADGKTLTEVGGAIGTGEKMKVVYDRQ
jgi:hypothetical protein